MDGARDVERLSVSSSGQQVSKAYETQPSVSPGGRFVVFESPASGLVRGDTNGQSDVFLRDRSRGTTVRVSVDAFGRQLRWGGSSPAMSPRGRFVLFNSSNPRRMLNRVWLYDRRTSSVRKIGPAGSFYGTAGAGAVDVSKGGRFIVFFTEEKRGPRDSDGFGSSAYVYDRERRVVRMMSVDDAGNDLGDAYPTQVTPNGRYVAFFTRSGQVYVRDRKCQVTHRVSVSRSGRGDRRWFSHQPAMSADGRFVAFTSTAPNLVRGDTNDSSDVFVRDLVKRVTVAVSVGRHGRQGDGRSSEPAISADGRYVVFTSEADNLVPGDDNGVADVFIHDRRTGTTRCLSVGDDGRPSIGRSDLGSVSASGRYTAFSTRSPLVDDDTNRTWDVYLHDTR